MSLDIIIRHQISEERIRDLLSGALEGGSNYWYMIENIAPDSGDIYHAPFNSTLGVTISDRVGAEGGKITFKRLNRKTMARGLTLMAEKYPRHFADFISENDDAITADVFLQLALFKELVYG